MEASHSQSRALSKAHVITVSDGVFHGHREDKSGPGLISLLRAGGFEVGDPEVVPDEMERIAEAIETAVTRGRHRRDHRRNGARPSRRHAAGDGIAHRIRGARDRRGDAARRRGEHSDGGIVASNGRGTRQSSDHQRAGQLRGSN